MTPYTAPGSKSLPIFGNSEAMKILVEVAKLYDTDIKTILKRTRKPETAEPRQMAMVRVYEELNLPMITVVRMFGLKSHRTFIHARQAMKDKEFTGQYLYKVDIIELKHDYLLVNGKQMYKYSTPHQIRTRLNRYEQEEFRKYVKKT